MFEFASRRKPERTPSVKPRREELDRFPSSRSLGNLHMRVITPFDLSRHKLWGTAGIPKVSDIQQGATGDCWFLSALAALTHTSPDYVKSLISVEENGRFLVQLDIPQSVGPLVPALESLFQKKRPMYAKVNEERATWAAVLEKAAAKRRTHEGRPSYDAIHAGSTSLAMQYLGIGPADSFTLRPEEKGGPYIHDLKEVCKPYPRSELLMTLESALRDGHLVTTGKFHEGTGGGHAYAVLYKNATDFTLYDPHGKYITVTEEELLAGIDISISRKSVPLAGHVSRRS